MPCLTKRSREQTLKRKRSIEQTKGKKKFQKKELGAGEKIQNHDEKCKKEHGA